MKHNKVGSAMTMDVVRATPTTPFKEVTRLLGEHDISGLPVVTRTWTTRTCGPRYRWSTASPMTGCAGLGVALDTLVLRARKRSLMRRRPTAEGTTKASRRPDRRLVRH
ncbi:hypothetical protein PV726_42315 [Streptomyces europaeiscabiei]|uniref:CBS domain-containing protein n=1 Tax=Streptomyces europaeiscabiei TaxID=146819 RepID=UPI0029A53AB5|nr:CBS domain-containing protein [Streptomyces europaeiscabiei]MDX3696771.1 hypothetical protein [Streptomyces europaeiscabiei]